MATSLELLDAVAPEFSGEPTATKNLFLELAASLLDPKAWGSTYATGAVYLAAHLMKVRPGSGGGSGAGAVTSEKALSWAVTYATVALTEADGRLGTTPYGLMFLNLRRWAVGVGAFVVTPLGVEGLP